MFFLFNGQQGERLSAHLTPEFLTYLRSLHQKKRFELHSHILFLAQTYITSVNESYLGWNVRGRLVFHLCLCTLENLHLAPSLSVEAEGRFLSYSVTSHFHSINIHENQRNLFGLGSQTPSDCLLHLNLLMDVKYSYYSTSDHIFSHPGLLVFFNFL